MKDRPRKLQKVSEEMQQWAALLATEVSQWPDVTLKPMFGMTAFYRKATIFGAVPATRSMGSPNGIILKIAEPSIGVKSRIESDPRVDATGGVGQKWYAFEMSSPKDISDALKCFSEAYEAAGPRQSAPRSQKGKQPNRNTQR